MSDLLVIRVTDTLAVSAYVDSYITIAILILIIFGFIISLARFGSNLEIDQTEIGIGDQKITLKPNNLDKEIAYKIWVELSTRKIGLPIDLEDDVIVEIYDSWYSFFAITRELIKDMPASKMKRKDTEKIISLSINILNKGLRPHLTKWQARFRRWYDLQIQKDDHAELHPQEIQSKFPAYDELTEEIIIVNRKLMAYRKMMYDLVKT